jgi:ABC-type Fe3+ transport system substrate-binding protein
MRIGVDVFFGGGVPIHRDIIERGFAEQIELPEELLAAIPETLNGSRLRSDDGTWFGSALSRFGILYNKQACQVRNVPVPTTWADLASADFVGWNTIADPSASGSTVKCFSLVLLSQGWQEGWGTALGILANCDGLSPSSSHVGINVRSGLALAGMAPEFVAQRLVAEHPDSLEYVNPRAMTVADPDPITVLRGAPNLEVARAFVEFVLSAEGQSLWALPPEDGGPASGPLHQNPIRPDVYETYADKLVVESNPFDRSDALQIDHQLDLAYTRLLPHLLIAANGENHLLLQKAYRTGMQQGPDSPIMKSLKEPPFPESMIQQYAARCAKDASDAAALEREWSRMFKAKYEALLDTPVAQQ